MTTPAPLDFSGLFDGFVDASGAIHLDGLGPMPPHRDNADPHPVIVNVHPREWVIPFAHQWEAEYEIEVEHPSTCSGLVEDCPVQDYLDNVGIDQDMYAAFPGPDDLTDDELAALDGTVRYVVMTRWGTSYETYYGTEYDGGYTFTWLDTDQPITQPATETAQEPADA